ncbi:hypothetical protein A2U01_0106365, partial [Trifolium medium]|nr:hypothetical protein [Trifolium medium]
VAQLSAAAGPASSPYDASRPVTVVPDTGDASLVVATTSGPTYYLQGQSQVLLPRPPGSSPSSRHCIPTVIIK